MNLISLGILIFILGIIIGYIIGRNKGKFSIRLIYIEKLISAIILGVYIWLTAMGHDVSIEFSLFAIGVGGQLLGLDVDTLLNKYRGNDKKDNG